MGKLFDIFAASTVGFISRPRIAVSTVGVYEVDAFVAELVEVTAQPDGSFGHKAKALACRDGTNEEATGANTSKTLRQPITGPHLFSRSITI